MGPSRRRHWVLLIASLVGLYASGCSRADDDQTSGMKEHFSASGHVFGESSAADGSKTFFIVVMTRVENAQITEVRIDDVPVKEGAHLFGDAKQYKSGLLDANLEAIELGKSRADYESTLKEMSGEPFFNMTGYAGNVGVGEGKHNIAVDVSWQGRIVTYDPWSVDR